MRLILFNFVRGFATSLEMEATAEADTGVTADEWMDVQKPALDALLADRDLPAFRAVLDSFEPDGYDMDLDNLRDGAQLPTSGVRSAEVMLEFVSHTRSNALRMASLSLGSCSLQRNPICRPTAEVGTVTMLSQLITDSWSRPFDGPTSTSTVKPRSREVIGATVTRER